MPTIDDDHDLEAHPSFLTPADIEEFREIVKEETGVEMDRVEAWNRALELLALYRSLLNATTDSKPANTQGMTAAAPSGKVPGDGTSHTLGQQRLPLAMPGMSEAQKTEP